MAEGQGPNVASELILMNPLEPYNTTGKPLPFPFLTTHLPPLSPTQQLFWPRLQLPQ